MVRANRSRISFILSSFPLPIDGGRILEHRLGLHPLLAVEFSIEAARMAGVAGDAARLLHLQQHRVRVAIQPYFPDLLHVPGFLALAPELVARARPVDRLAAACGL